MQTIHNFQSAHQIIYGNDSLQSIDEYFYVFDDVRRVLIVTIDRFDKEIETIRTQLGNRNIVVDLLTGVEPEPTISHIHDLFNQIKNKKYDVLIGMGGGSVLDATKVLSVMLTNDTPLEDMVGTELIPNRGVPMVLIPTTSGTGSEVTPNAIVTFPDQELKIGIVSRYFMADLVLLDPMLTISVPPQVTAATGMDAFTHSFESYISNKSNPISDMFAMESMRLISRSILRAYRDGSDLEARQDMLLGSTYGGMALTSAGTAAVHALAYPLGGKFHISHGEANSMLLPHVTRFNLDQIENKMAKIAREIGILENNKTDDREAAELLISNIESWTTSLNIPQDLSKFGVKEEDVSGLAVAAAKVTRLLNNNPKVLSVEDMEDIYKKLLNS
ncbi:iron-containing alcohol dehydrogenase [Radiobacillus kanasensis]|uniref:iron-containing alcohol dehydrogenase n=1 Tax=Radiobacillus kanasensis TaxID=2844358 RepID=UPI001E64DBE2|nr:iron-containing alcohol dehydrogenase [Radiobacillus kanasensis]UFT98779.1 iron-containing alcohol dehydrogenase [Radiobacillus kanasensis]